MKILLKRKVICKKHDVSLSRMIENYMQKVTLAQYETVKISPLA